MYKRQSLKYPEDIAKIRLHVEQLGYDPNYYVYEDVVSQTPYSPYQSNESGHNIWVLKEDGSVSELSQASEIVRALTRADLKAEAKIYFPKERL